jgi:hypothetical protein
VDVERQRSMILNNEITLSEGFLDVNIHHFEISESEGKEKRKDSDR